MARPAWAVARALLVIVSVLAALVGPTPVASAKALTGIEQLSARIIHACAALSNGQARCWGSNGYGELGDGTRKDRGAPVAVKGPSGTARLTGIARVAAGLDHGCAVLENGQARCWGHNETGQLGDGTKEERLRPVVVANGAGTGALRRVRDVAAGSGHTCALLRSGQVRCWGDNGYGQLGDGTRHERLLPVVVKDPSGSGPLTGVVGLDAGVSHTCALLESGQMRCWGYDDNGESGDGGPINGGTAYDHLLPVAVVKVSGPGNLKALAQIALGEYESCALTESGQARCWGYGPDGEIGDGGTDSRSRPAIVKDPSGGGPLKTIADLGIGGYHGCARLVSRKAVCWGDDDSGQLGDGTPSDHEAIAVAVRKRGGGRLAHIAQLGAGYAFTCARFANGTAKCWGANDRGQLGDGSFDESHVPVIVGT